MKFAEYVRCDGCGKMIPEEPYVTEGKRFCSKECYDFIQWYQERKAFYLRNKVGRSPQIEK
jgi:endogenous inhibitor of DNA gyrase (YacG/DUF329 family)